MCNFSKFFCGFLSLVIILSLLPVTSFAVDCGDVNNDGNINILDIVYLINYKYKSGPVPLCIPITDCADVNSDGNVDILDIVHLINYKYKGGPEPFGGEVTDIDGNTYQAVKIGDQWWMAENLKVTHYRNGEAIPNVTNGTTWIGLTSGAYCEQNNDVNNVATYGRLYNWYAIDDNRNIAPIGWHIPTYDEWLTMCNYLGGVEVAGDKLKEAGNTHWWYNEGATNESGFTALPGGYRAENGNYYGISAGPACHALFWHITESDGDRALHSYLHCQHGNISITVPYRKLNGMSVRCIKDNSGMIPMVTTAGVSAITQTMAQCGGTVISDGGASVTARGVCWSTNPTPTVSDSKTINGAGTGSFGSSIAGLTANTTYYIRAYATNSVGTGYGSIIPFTTLPVAQVPMVSTASVSEITGITAQCGGTITSDGGASVTARGVCWSTNPAPTISDSKTINGAGTGSFTSSITGLTGNTTYYVRAYATNSAGAGYGNIVAFTTGHETGTVADIDGNIYQTVKIGNQWWMAENLKVTHYRNGNIIPNVIGEADWCTVDMGAYCEYGNDINNVATYGRIYNLMAVGDSRNIAPAGWHVPSDVEWQTLTDYLGGDAIAGGKMKETGTTHWLGPNTGATNESGFTGLPGGYRDGYGFAGGKYNSLYHSGYFWPSAGSGDYEALALRLRYYQSEIVRLYKNRRAGFSVRCVKD